MKSQASEQAVGLTLRADDPAAEPARPLLLVRRREAAKMCGLSPASWARLVSRGLVPRSIKLGSAVLWRVDELRAWTEAGCPPRAEWEALRAVVNGNGSR